MEFQELDQHSSKPLYLQIVDIIAQKIRSGEFPVDKKIPNQEYLRKVFNVSRDTIQVAFSNLVRDGYVSRRRSYGTVVISSEPRKELILKKKNEISIVFCPFEGNVEGYIKRDTKVFLDRLIIGIEEKVREKGTYLVYSTINKSKLTLEGKEEDIAGMIVAGEITPEILKIVKKPKIPFVLIGDIFQKTPPTEKIDIIASDDFGNAYTAMKHLIDLGHRRIAYFTRDQREFYWGSEVYKGYRKAFKEAGIPHDKELEIRVKEENPEADGYAEMKEFLDKSVTFTALVYSSESFEEGILKALGEKGLSVPEDISVIGIDIKSSKLTSIIYDAGELGKAAADRLFERIVNPELETGRIIVSAPLVLNDSTRKFNSRRSGSK